MRSRSSSKLIGCTFALCICCAGFGLFGPLGGASNASAQGITCPIADPLCQNLASQCTTTVVGTQCVAKKIISDPLVAGGIRALNCGCDDGSSCGHIVFIAASNSVQCAGQCPVPPVGNDCNVIVTIPGGAPSPVGPGPIAITAYPQGTTFECGCAPTTPPPCTPNAAGTACNATQCPPDSQGLPQTCVPRCIRVDANGQQTVVDCQCIPDGQCHVVMGPALPICQGTCPAGFICESSKTFNPADGSTTYCCDCHPDPHCQPLPDGSACPPNTCPPDSQGLAQVCRPKCIEIDFNGVSHVINCECGNPNACHAEPGPAGSIPTCAGICPPGYTCVQHVYPTATGTAYCCDCRPDPEFCEPTADRQACKQFICPPDSQGLPEHCKPKCVKVNPATGQYFILECDCVGDNKCYVELGGPPPSEPHCVGVCPDGQFCVTNRTDNADGTYTICCLCADPPCDCPGDLNGDGIINGLDIAGFTRCFLGTSQPGDNCSCADINDDGVLNNVDIVLFVNRILAKVQCSPTPCCPKSNLNLNLATGVDDNGVVLPANSNDPHWIVTIDPNGGTVPRPSTTVTPHPSWVTFPNSSWVSANYFGVNGDYEYKFCFCLDPRARNPVLSLQVRADDFGQVYLNGNLLGNASGFSVVNVPAISTSNPSYFHPGENCIVVKVQNVGGAPTGLNMIGSVTALDGKCCCDPADLNKDIRSGVYDNNGPFIAVGQDDDTWTVTCDATGGSVPRPAQVITPHPLWATIPGTRWISATTGATNGLYCYQYCFCLDPRFRNAALTMDLLADDYAEVYLNGTLVGQTPMGWAFLNPPTHISVTNQALFKDCQNCIEIKVLNAGGVITGMDVGATITAQDGLCCDDRQKSCCLPDGTCVDLAPGATSCPDGSQTLDGPCGSASISCCLPNGTCITMSQRCCLVSGGTPLPVGSTCGGAPQACCIPANGVTTCQNLDPACCVAKGGNPQGAGSHCLGDSNGDGNDDLCVPPPPVCPLGADFGSSLCASHQGTQCQSNLSNLACRPKVVITQGQGQGIFVEQCSCFATGTGAGCGPINIQPAAGGNYVLGCAGACGFKAGCSLFVNGNPFGASSVNSGSLPAGSTVTCGCYIP
jgi:hypothetical protein